MKRPEDCSQGNQPLRGTLADDGLPPGIWPGIIQGNQGFEEGDSKNTMLIMKPSFQCGNLTDKVEPRATIAVWDLYTEPAYSGGTLKTMRLLFLVTFLSTLAAGQEINCDLAAYKAQDGLKAQTRSGGLEVTWLGERNEQLRAVFAIHNGQPMVDELALPEERRQLDRPGKELNARVRDHQWRAKRLSEQQIAPLRDLKTRSLHRTSWSGKNGTFWDSPLVVPGRAGTNMGLPRKPEEIRRAWSKIQCHRLQSDHRRSGAAGSFFPRLRRRHLHRLAAIHGLSRHQPAPAGGHRQDQRAFGRVQIQFRPERLRHRQTIHECVWRDNARGWQHYAFGGAVNQQAVALRARNRLAILEANGGSLAFLPPSHKFFWSREVETNLGYVYYRKDGANAFAIGARQADREMGAKPWGISDEVWNRRVAEARGDLNNFALYNAPPGSEQRMPVYFYLSPENSRATQEAVMAFTHDDVYKPLPGYKVLVSHFHFHFNEQLTDAGTLDQEPTWLSVFRALGINMAILADFHGDSHPADTGHLRFDEQKVYFEGCQRFSDRDMLLIPGEEPDANFGGHYMFVFPKPLAASHVKQPAKGPAGQPFEETLPAYGKVYHTSTATATELTLLQQEAGPGRRQTGHPQN